MCDRHSVQSVIVAIAAYRLTVLCFADYDKTILIRVPIFARSYQNKNTLVFYLAMFSLSRKRTSKLIGKIQLNIREILYCIIKFP